MLIPKICITINSLIGLKSQLQTLTCSTLACNSSNNLKLIGNTAKEGVEQNFNSLILPYVNFRLASW